MIKYLFIIFLLISSIGFSQVTTEPALPFATQNVTVTFDSSKESRLGYFTGELYAHTGLITNQSTSDSDWKYVIESWGNNTTQPKLTNKGNGIYELQITPDINTFYSVSESDAVIKMAFVFRSSDGSKQTNNLYINVYEEGLVVEITEPENNGILAKNQPVSISARSSVEASLKLFLNETTLTQNTGTEISTNYTFTESGTFWLIAEAVANDETTRDSAQVFVRQDVINEPRPVACNTGINYPSNTSATLVLWAPLKEFVFVVGDFNEWKPSNEFQMKKDGDFFWLEIPNLNPGEEYAFQYLVDGNIWIADPYTEKILDPWDDKWIDETIYPNLKPFPEECAFSRVSLLQTNQQEYAWQTTSYPIPKKENLVIYELLIRDFTDEQTYKAVMDTLGYLKTLGVNAIEFMPFNEFEGNNSWGYNPNFYFAPDKAYGTKNDLKKLIDECHKQGFVVVQDMVLNHAYNSCPLVKLYWDSANNRPAADNPWFNVTSPNPVFAWGSDFNHESQATKDFVDRVTKYWMEEYKVDGFRFDFTKGFTNTSGDGSSYDASRIAILKRMANQIWNVNPLAFIILEHFAPDTEEWELVKYNSGMLVWGNASYNFGEAAMGYHDSGKSDFSRASYQNRGFQQPGLVAYMESHDEERQVYKTKTYGNAVGSYNTRTLSTALDRSKLAATFFFSLPGPKMIWQFGELGYDFSINTCENGSIKNDCRTSPKEVRWDYYANPDRKKLFDVYSGMINLRDQFNVFTSGTETLNLSGELKSIHLTKNDTNIVVLGNFGMAQASMNPNFQHTGAWYEFFTGQEYNVASTTTEINLQAGEFMLFSNVPLPEINDFGTNSDFLELKNDWMVYPNPAFCQISISSATPFSNLKMISLSGNIVFSTEYQNVFKASINTNEFKSGVYFIQIIQNNRTDTKKIIIQ